MVLDNFHPTVSIWFKRSFDSPTEIQEKAWREIQKKSHTLISAPTGSGKTLAAFLASIDDLVSQSLESGLPDKTQVVYVSPLKALSNDIENNLQAPLKGINEELENMGLSESGIRVAVRTGDTPASARTKMTKTPPHILVTTPESLYLILTSKNGREMLSDVHTLIVDEIHALVDSKRGSHMSLSAERLEALTNKPLTRIGLSATQKPIDLIAKFLTGVSQNETSPCKIVNAGHKRKLDLSIEVPASPLAAIMSNEVWSEIYERLEQLINQHQTTLIFVNTRRLAERMTHNLTERFGTEILAAHHGSISKEMRLDAEKKLKSGELKAIVATASLELGIDIGSVDLVCQIGSSKSIATFLQRVGRSGHTVKGTPKGKIFPLSLDELVECAALLDSIKRGELDSIIMPEKPLDVLAQQIVAEVSCREYDEEELFQLYKNAYPYRSLDLSEFNDVLKMLSEGFTVQRGRRGAYIHHDIVNGRIRARKGARLAALISGGTIPDSFDYDVVLEPTNTFIGTVNEDFAIESVPGDVFLLGNHSWRILKVNGGKVRVEDAGGLPPTIPFWFGEAPGRSVEFSEAVSRLREEISQKIGNIEDFIKEDDLVDSFSNDSWKANALSWLTEEVGLTLEAADQLVVYMATVKAALGLIPTHKKLVIERFFDEAGAMHLVVHSPYGSRLNRAWGLALRKRFCRKFNFELQAAAAEDSIILSLGATHSFPLEEVYQYLHPNSVRNVLTQALLDAPMFEVRWRWNASTALAVLRRWTSKKVPPAVQRIHSEDLIAQVFPDQIACLENVVGEREIPDHPLVNQTIYDCLYEAMDIENLENLLVDINAGEIELNTRDLTEPSPLSQQILNARPYAFLDDVPLEERRTHAVQNRRWLDPSEAAELGQLDPEAIKIVKSEAWPEAENADDLHDALVLCGFLTAEEGEINGWKQFFDQLISENRATLLITKEEKAFWVAIERLNYMISIYNDANLSLKVEIPERLREKTVSREEALVEIVRSRLEALGPVTVNTISLTLGVSSSEVDQALLKLEGEGFVFRGNFTPGLEELEWCERRLLARINKYTLTKLRKEIEPVSSSDFMRFLFSWQGVSSDEQPEGVEALRKVLDQLEGFEAPAASWEGDIFSARLKNYDHTWMDTLCLSGSAVWGRFRIENTNGSKKSSPIKTTPITIVKRSNLDTWKNISRASENNLEDLSNNAKKVFDFISSKGASFFEEIISGSKCLRTETEIALAELVAKGLITSDSYTGLRALLVRSKYKTEKGRRKKRISFNMEGSGRWSLIKKSEQQEEKNKNISEDMRALARIFLSRYGVVFRKLLERENFAPPWRDLVRALRLLELRGEVRGGRFVEGGTGEQFALPEAVASLRDMRRKNKTGELVSLSASDPLNLMGIITPGKKVSSHYKNRVLYRDGVPAAFKEGDQIRLLSEFDNGEEWSIKQKLIKRNFSPKLKPYLGKGAA
ncbi:MAG: ATP-dependent DNA helicase [Thermodesulfobacteriota bacterium]|nr:MAG: ATP-dependent DNA helicase [Thermodesulfobacteriota bacterium]